MEAGTIAAIVSIIGVISGALLGWLGRSRSIKQDTVAEADRDATLRADVAHIRHSVDEMRAEQKSQGQRFDVLAERVTRVEESVKQAHHRLNRLDGQGGGAS